MRRNSLNRLVPSNRRQMILTFHFPPMADIAYTKSDDSQSKREALDFILTHPKPQIATAPSLVAINGNLSRHLLKVCPREAPFVSAEKDREG
jgi:hypothetical protein